MKTYVLAFALFVCHCSIFSQVAVGSTSPDPSSILDIVSIDKGLLPPRLASDANVDDPAEGLVIYDESDDCLNVFDGSVWINLCNAGSGGSGGTGGGTTNPPVAGQNLYSWGTPLRFSQVMMPKGGQIVAMVTATSTDGNAYVWGDDRRVLIRNWAPTTDATVGTNDINTSSSFDRHLISPQRLNDPAFNGKVKGFYNTDDLFAIHTTDGEVYTFGHNGDDLQNEPSASFSRYLIKTRPLEMPAASASATVVDFKLSKLTYFIITSDGKAYWRGADLGGEDASNGWKEIAEPTGPSVPANFEYTEFLNKAKATNNQIFMKGSNNRVYAAGSSREELFGSNYDDNNTDPTQSSGIVEIEFPAGVAEKVVRIKDQTYHIAAITSDGEIYAWGRYSRNNGDLLAFKLDPSAPVPTFFNQSGGRQFIKTPTKIALPAGETSLLDIDFDEGGNFDNPTVVVGGSGASYIIGGNVDNEHILAENREPFLDYTPLWSADRVVAKEVYIVGDIVGYLDGAGQYLHFGDIKGSGGFSNLNTPASFKTPVALPITDGTKDSTNPNPQ